MLNLLSKTVFSVQVAYVFTVVLLLKYISIKFYDNNKENDEEWNPFTPKNFFVSDLPDIFRVTC